MSGDLIDTTEMYLRTIVELEEEGIAPLRARIAERLEQSSPTVSQTVARMERDGLLTVHEDRRIELSDQGRRRGLEVMRRHRLAECMLVSVLNIPLEQVHDEACRWEHVITEVVETSMFQLLGSPLLSPYGTPIPALDQLGHDTAAPGFLDGVQRVVDLGDDVEVTVARFSENVQRDAELLAQLVQAGVLPEAQCRVRRLPIGWELSTATGRCMIGAEDAQDVFVTV